MPGYLRHTATPKFWALYEALPPATRELAVASFNQLKQNPRHPSLHFKQIGKFWTVRVGLNYRAAGIESQGNLIWFWIGSHTEYDLLLKRS